MPLDTAGRSCCNRLFPREYRSATPVFSQGQHWLKTTLRARELTSGPFFLLAPSLWAGLGLVLIILTHGHKQVKLVYGLGWASFGFFACTILHNLLFAGSLLTANIFFLSELLGLLSAAFFLLGVVVCPLAYSILAGFVIKKWSQLFVVINK